MAVAFPRAAYVENRTGILQHVFQNGWLRLELCKPRRFAMSTQYSVQGMKHRRLIL